MDPLMADDQFRELLRRAGQPLRTRADYGLAVGGGPAPNDGFRHLLVGGSPAGGDTYLPPPLPDQPPTAPPPPARPETPAATATARPEVAPPPRDGAAAAFAAATRPSPADQFGGFTGAGGERWVTLRDAAGTVREQRPAADLDQATADRWAGQLDFERARSRLGPSIAGSWELDPRNALLSAQYRQGIAAEAQQAVDAAAGRGLRRDELAQQRTLADRERDAQMERLRAELESRSAIADAESRSRADAARLGAQSGLLSSGLNAMGDGADPMRVADAARSLGRAAAGVFPPGGQPATAPAATAGELPLLPEATQRGYASRVAAMRAALANGVSPDAINAMVDASNAAGPITPEERQRLAADIRGGAIGDLNAIVGGLAGNAGANQLLFGDPPRDATGTAGSRYTVTGDGGRPLFTLVAPPQGYLGRFATALTSGGDYRLNPYQAVDVPGVGNFPLPTGMLPNWVDRNFGTGGAVQRERQRPRVAPTLELLQLLARGPQEQRRQ